MEKLRVHVICTGFQIISFVLMSVKPNCTAAIKTMPRVQAMDECQLVLISHSNELDVLDCVVGSQGCAFCSCTVAFLPRGIAEDSVFPLPKPRCLTVENYSV